MTDLGANVVLIPESIVYGETLDDYTLTVDYNLPLAKRTAQVPKLGDSYPGDTAPWGYIVVETGSATSRKSPDQGAYITGVKYAKPKRPYDTGIVVVSGTSSGSNTTLTLKDTSKTWTVNAYASYTVTITGGTGSGQWRLIASNTATALTVSVAWTTTPDATSTYKIWALTEIMRKKDTARPGQHLGVRVFLVPDSIADAVAETYLPEGAAMEASGTWLYALLHEKTIERNWRVGLAKITASYDIPEIITYTDTLEDYILQRDYRIPLSAWVAQLPALGAAYTGNTAPWGYIVVESASSTSGTGPSKGDYQTSVKYAKPKVPYESGVVGLKEIYRRLDTGRQSRRMGLRVFLAADANAESIADASLPELKPMTDAGNWRYALLREKQIERNWRVGIAKITAAYDTYAPSSEFIYVNKGILEADATAVMMWNRVVVPGTTRRIDEIYWDDGVRKSWVRVAGNNGWPLIKADLRIRAVLTTSNLVAVKSLVGAVNENACSAILGAAAGTLWFDRFSMRQRKRGQSTLFDCIIGLAYDPIGWDAETLAQLQKYDIRQEVVYAADGTTALGKHNVGSWIPDPDANLTKIPIPGNTANFSILNGYLS